MAAHAAASAPSLLGRAILAILLMIGFYILALSIAAALLLIVCAEIWVAHRINLQITFFCLAGAGVILWSLIPRPDTFVAPGPLLLEKSFPRLFVELERTAQRVGQSMPGEVYLVPDVNAWVSQRGGVMGIGSRRIMGVGLPLLQVLTVRELRAVLAHEFGHYHGGDTALGPWIYSTRAAIGRTLVQLAERSRFLTIPFRIYGALFLRVTHAISRAQEYAADALSVRTEGAPAMASALRKIDRAAALFPAYWQQEVAAVLQAGFRPPITAGFVEFMRTVERDNLVNEEALRKAAEAEDPYDTHPPLARRLEALEKVAASRPSGEQDQHAADVLPAIRLAGDPDTLESIFFGSIDSLTPALRPKFAPIRWDEVGHRVYVPMIKQVVTREAPVLRGVTFRALSPKLLESWSDRLAANTGKAPWNEQVRSYAAHVTESAVLLALIDRGWEVRVEMAKPIVLARGEQQVAPATKVRELAQGQLSEDDWLAWCNMLEIADLELVPGEFRAPARPAQSAG